MRPQGNHSKACASSWFETQGADALHASLHGGCAPAHTGRTLSQDADALHASLHGGHNATTCGCVSLPFRGESWGGARCHVGHHAAWSHSTCSVQPHTLLQCHMQQCASLHVLPPPRLSVPPPRTPFLAEMMCFSHSATLFKNSYVFFLFANKVLHLQP